MTYLTKALGSFLVVHLDGEIDLESAPRLRQHLLESLNLGSSLLVEMSGVGYIDSSGIASLVEALQNARKRRLDLKLIAPSNRVRRVLELARLDKVFDIYPDLETAQQ